MLSLETASTTQMKQQKKKQWTNTHQAKQSQLVAAQKLPLDSKARKQIRKKTMMLPEKHGNKGWIQVREYTRKRNKVSTMIQK